MTNDPTSAAYEELRDWLAGSFTQFLESPPRSNTGTSCEIAANYAMIRMNALMEQAIAEAETRGRNMDLTPDKMLLAENKRLREAGDALYEAASYTGRTFDGTHRLLSAAAHYLDTVGKNSGKYQSELQANADGANGRDGEEK